MVGTIQVHKLVLTGHTECQFQLNTPLGELEICDKTALTKSYLPYKSATYNMFSNNLEWFWSIAKLSSSWLVQRQLLRLALSLIITTPTPAHPGK